MSTLPDRFWAKAIKAPSGCWIWTGARHWKGYGRFMLDGKARAAHRLAYADRYGQLPDDLVIDHLCRVPRCVNPMHLQAVTVKVNTNRGYGAFAHKNIGTCGNGLHPWPESARRTGSQLRCAPCANEAGREYRRRQSEGKAA